MIIANKSDIVDELEIERELDDFALKARLRVVRRAPARAFEMHVAPAAHAAVRHHHACIWAIEVGDERTSRVERDGADRDLERDICPVPSRLASARAVGAGFGVPPTSALVAREVVQLVCSGEDYRAAATTVTTVWAASRHKRFASK